MQRIKVILSAVMWLFILVLSDVVVATDSGPFFTHALHPLKRRNLSTGRKDTIKCLRLFGRDKYRLLFSRLKNILGMYNKAARYKTLQILHSCRKF